jgi:hypothetical protein
MGAYVLPFVAFVLWEFPSMIVMSLHKAACALLGRSLAEDFLGIWAYRLAGVLLFWPVTVFLVGLATAAGWPGPVGRVFLAFEAMGVAVLLVWARVSRRGA